MSGARDWFDWSGWFVGVAGLVFALWQQRQHILSKRESDAENRSLRQQLEALQRTSGATHEIVNFRRPDPPRPVSPDVAQEVLVLVRRLLGGDGTVTVTQVLDWAPRHTRLAPDELEGAIARLVEEGRLAIDGERLRIQG